VVVKMGFIVLRISQDTRAIEAELAATGA